MTRKLLLTFLFCLTLELVYSQNSRITDHNRIGWYVLNTNIKLDDKWSVASEFQWRRDKTISEPMQNLFRTGLNLKVNPKLGIRAGYALAETYHYGDIPVNNLGRQFTEHRTWQMVNLSDKIKTFEFNHRFMLEQRWIGKYTNNSIQKEDQFIYANRLRYMFRMQVPFKGDAISDKVPYAALYNEILIGFGKNVNENVFDQNRLGVLLGYRFSELFRVEGGFLNQIAQLSREVNGNNVFQNNKGIILSTFINL